MAEQIGEIWSDIDHRLVQDAQGLLKKVINIKAVQTSVDNILRTRKGERVMLPEFGAGLNDVVFESMNSPLIDLISRDLKNEIETWDDRVTVTQVRYLDDPDNNSVVIEISFTIKGFYKIFKQEVSIKGEAS